MRKAPSLLRAAAAAGAFALLLTACGQKPGIHDPRIAQGGGGGTGGATTGDVGTTTDGTATDGGDGTSGADGTTTDGSPTTGGSSTTGGTTTTGGATTDGSATDGAATSDGGSTGGDTTGSTGGGGQPATPQGSDRTGVEQDAIHLSIHAPVTGAAPLPTTSFEKARDTYWEFLESKDVKVLGRGNVTVEFKDDKYEPNSARQACRELASRTFTIVGGGGTDQIQACGQFAGVAKVPYFSAGVTEQGLTGNPWYFASSMTYKQQGPLLAQYVAKNFPGKRTAMIVTDTPNFDDAIDGWMTGVQQQKLDYYRTLKHPKGDTSWINSYISDLKSEGVEVVYILSSPVNYIQFAQQAQEQNATFQYVGVGVTMGLNAVLDSGCGQVHGGIFFSPFPGLDVIDQLDPDFRAASRAQNAPADDIALALWGIARQQHQMFDRYQAAYGDDLTREDFRALVSGMQGLRTNVYPEINYSPQDHFGAETVHVIQADCETKQHKTLATFASSF